LSLHDRLPSRRSALHSISINSTSVIAQQI
jgi:hypothetical protein